MSYSSIVGADKAPVFPSGRTSELLGPSDNSDSGSDALGTGEIHGDSDSGGTGERGAVSGIDTKEGADILPDRVVRIGGPDGNPDSDSGDEVFTDLDEAVDFDDATQSEGGNADIDTDTDSSTDIEGRPGLRRP